MGGWEVGLGLFDQMPVQTRAVYVCARVKGWLRILALSARRSRIGAWLSGRGGHILTPLQGHLWMALHVARGCVASAPLSQDAGSTPTRGVTKWKDSRQQGLRRRGGGVDGERALGREKKREELGMHQASSKKPATRPRSLFGSFGGLMAIP